MNITVNVTAVIDNVPKTTTMIIILIYSPSSPELLLEESETTVGLITTVSLLVV